MSDFDIESNKTRYELITNLPEYNDEDFVKKDSKKIEDILIDLYSFSNRFQLTTFFVICFFFFILGMQEFTFVYVFLSPEFYLKRDPTKSRSLYLV